MEDLSIIESLDFVQSHAMGSHLNDKFWSECKEHLDFLSTSLELTPRQVILVAVISEVGDSMSWRQLGKFLGVSRLQAMNFTPDVEDLKDKGWLTQHAAMEGSKRYDGIKLVTGVIRALRNNEKFIPEDLSGLSEQVFVDRLTRYMVCEGQDNDIMPQEVHRWVMQFAMANKQLPLCQQMDKIKRSSFMILMFIVSDYARFAGTDDEGMTAFQLRDLFYDYLRYDRIAEKLQNGTHELFDLGLIEHYCDEGMVDENRYCLTSSAREKLLANFKPRRGKKQGKYTDRDLRKCSEIKVKNMFYNPEESLQIDRLKRMLSKDGFLNVQQRLEECGLRKGIACLFYGTSGTGKTETVLQLAKETGRDIMEVNIAGLRDKFVGESEKNIKGVFSRYRDLCNGKEVTPILFFNEADAIINTRLERTSSSVEKMDNAIQNIILQEMENLDGILIATTNLTGNLDRAFDRRFLFKIEFTKPSIEAKSGIWRSMLPDLGKEESMALASKFDFSGGQIENIARKCKIEYAITGEKVPFTQIRDFCSEENINRHSGNKIGF